MLRRSLFVVATILLVGASSAIADTGPARVYVQVRETKMRTEPKYWASPIAALKYGDSVEAQTPQDGWVKAKNHSGKSGYLPLSAVSTRKVVFAGSAASSKADASDVVLAGKGFSAEVEKSYAHGNSRANFSAVNEMERTKVGDNELRTFLKNGKLSQ